MRICDLNTGTMQLTKAAKRLRDHWDATRPFWSDQNATEFEQQVLQPLSPQLAMTLNVVTRMAQLLEQAERECWDEEHP